MGGYHLQDKCNIHALRTLLLVFLFSVHAITVHFHFVCMYKYAFYIHVLEQDRMQVLETISQTDCVFLTY